jgi:FAD binding domain/Berberine and berberine like
VPALTRRQFVRRAGSAVAAASVASQLEWLAGCGGGSGPDWQQLAKHLEGKLVLPNQHGYLRVSTPLNLRYADVHPQAVALCATSGDALTSLAFARDNEVPVAVRSGGHNYAGYSTGPGLVIDFSNMRRVLVDDANGRLVVAPGARNTDVYAGLQPHGVAISAGRCPSVAIGGLTLGGGVGFSSRKLGLTCDSLVEADVVTADGRLLTVNDHEHPDLFWGLRGGGGGNFGISTSYTFRTHPVSDVTLYSLVWDFAHTAKVFAAFQQVMARAPDEFSARIGIGRPGKPGARPGTPTITALGQFFGPKTELVALLDPVLSAAKPASALIAPRTFWQAKNYFFDTTPYGNYEVKSAYARRPLSHAGIELLVDHIQSWPGSSNGDGAGMAMFLSGGAINRVAADATAFVHRDEFALIALETTWTTMDSDSVSRRGLDWIEGFADALRPHVSGFAYQNFIDRSQPDWEHAYYGSNFARLKKVKRRYDPDDVFRFEQSIPLA